MVGGLVLGVTDGPRPSPDPSIRKGGPLVRFAVAVIVASVASGGGVYLYTQYLTHLNVSGINWQVYVNNSSVGFVFNSERAGCEAVCPTNAQANSVWPYTLVFPYASAESNLSVVNITLPLPFHIVGISPSIPRQLPAGPGSVSFQIAIQLPPNPGSYSVLGAVWVATPPPTPKGKVNLLGAGATSPCPLLTTWSNEYASVTKAAPTGPQVIVNYNCVGSGAGITQITQKIVQFAGTDAPLNPSERAAAPNLLHIPETVGAVTAAYNVAEIPTGLNLTGDTIAEIYRGVITTWNHANISRDNPALASSLPARTIVPVYRSDSSGTTFVFTSFLHLSNEWWPNSMVGKSIPWPVGSGAPGNSGVAGRIQTTPDSFGYVELAYTVQNNMKVAKIKNPSGNWITPSLASTQAAAAALTNPPPPEGDWNNVSILNPAGATAYPIATLTYLLVYKELNVLAPTINQTKAQELVNFLWWAVHDGQNFSEPLAYPKLPAGLVTLDEGAIRSITYNGQTLHG